MANEPNKEWETGLIGGIEKRVIEIVSYQCDWPLKFQRFAEHIKKTLPEIALQIEHIGSTSVKGLAAKPIIDILVVVLDTANEDLYLPDMQSSGYQLRVREPDFEEHRMFRTPGKDVQIHFYPAASSEIKRHLLFRDFLRINLDARDQYAALNAN